MTSADRDGQLHVIPFQEPLRVHRDLAQFLTPTGGIRPQIHQAYHHLIRLRDVSGVPATFDQLLHYVGDDKLNQLAPFVQAHARQLVVEMILIFDDKQDDSKIQGMQRHLKRTKRLFIRNQGIGFTFEQPVNQVGP
ncbi:hypothetical protein D3C81_926850 [compost metagenome]